MNRSRLTEEFRSSSVLNGDIVVAERYTHPVRGPVVCPAAPLLVAWLRGQGVPARPGSFDRLSPSEGRAAGAARTVVASTSYLDGPGRAVGLAVAAGRDDAEVATAAVRTWSAVLRTRRVILPFPNRSGSSERHQEGAARSVPGTRREAAMDPRPQGSGCVDPGCPGESTAWGAVREYQGRGDTVLMLGRRAGRESALRTPAGVDADRCVPVRTLEDAGEELRAEAERLSFVVRPCAPIEEVAPLLRGLRERFPLLRGQHPDDWCYAASDRRNSHRLAAEASDLVLVLGDPPDADPLDADPLDLGRTQQRRISTLADLAPQDLRNAGTITLADADTGTDTPVGVTVADLIGVLGGLGPLSVVRQGVRTETDAAARDPRGADPRGADPRGAMEPA